MRLREKRYAARWTKRFTACCPVISVGNISWGGTGKTPLVDWLLGWAEARGLAPVVLTRGYGGKPPRLPFSVGDTAVAVESGDEPLYLAGRHPGALVLVDPRRARAAAWAEKNARPDLFVLDDGMQHLAVERDVNLVLLRPEDVLDEWDRVIPAGSWRESAQALGRADAFLLRADPVTAGAVVCAAEKRLAPFGKPLFFFHLASSGLRLLEAGGPLSGCTGREPLRQANLGVEDYVLACAVGNPALVLASAEKLLGKAPVFFHAYADHHAFTKDDALRLGGQGLPVVCTGKDAVKLRTLLQHFDGVPVWEMDAVACFGASLFCRDSFPLWWESVWSRLSPSPRGAL